MTHRDEHIAELKRIAWVLDQWAAALPIRRVLVFGSRVRGDHHLAIELFRDTDFAAMPDHGDALIDAWTTQER
jgi:hypothetical protein